VYVPVESAKQKRKSVTVKVMENNKCLCGEGDFIVLACSGASDVGHITDLVARKLSKNGVRKMNCLAMAGAGIEKSVESFKKSNLLILDGCPVDCGKKIAVKAGIENYSYVRITDLGYKKGSTEVAETVIDEVYNKVEILF
jgi:uncharacterized metal-binding protein